MLNSATIVHANTQHGRYAARLDDGCFIAFELTDTAELCVGDIITGKLDALGSETFRMHNGERFSVFMEITGGNRISALAWASSRT